MTEPRVLPFRPRRRAAASAVVSTRLPLGFVEALDLAASSQGLTRAEYLRDLAEGGVVRDLDDLAHGRVVTMTKKPEAPQPPVLLRVRGFGAS